jgi:DNA invertase Pin-like site-specific DNA recombinase
MSSKGQRIGYVRLSSYDQNPDRQLEHFDVDRVFTDKASGKDTERPQLKALLSYAREGDTIAVHSMDRLTRNIGLATDRAQRDTSWSPHAVH